MLSSEVRRRLRSVLKEPPWRSANRFDLLDWNRFDQTVARRGPELRQIADAHPVVKDPRFCWTLGVWAAAAATVDHVLVSVRSMESMLDSRVAAGWLAPRSREGGRNWFAYGLGLCLAACQDHRLAHSVVQFPDFVEEPEALFEAMRFPRPVAREEFLRIFSELARSELVRDRR